jgi:DsbC/DsbD-like thiol-disulfide interchange protein
VVSVRASLDSPTYAFFQRLHATVVLSIAPGFHVYAAPAPPGSTALAVEVEPLSGLAVGEARWPAPRRFATGGDTLLGYEGEVAGVVPLTFGAPAGAGDQRVRLTVRYQACRERECRPPASAVLELPVTEVPHVGRSLPARPAGA